MRLALHTFGSVTFALLVALSLLVGCTQRPAGGDEAGDDEAGAYDPAADSLRFPGEDHLRNVRQLTFGGNNAEAYWSFDDEHLIMQSDWDRINDHGCDQEFVMTSDGSPLDDGAQYRLVSTGLGRTTCGYFLPDGRIIYASTHAASRECPPPVFQSQGRYVWPVYQTYDLYVAGADGSNPELLIGGEGYDAEATVSPDGRYIIYTSTRSGDLDLWRYEIATGENVQLTHTLGYDGGGYFSPDSKRIVWRASRPQGEEADVYRSLLAEGLVEPRALNIFVADVNGENVQQVTHLPGANWAPFFHPSGDKIIFASNHHTLDQGGRLFDIFLVNVDGTGLEQITHSGTFDAFPMFSFDGTKLVFASNRNAQHVETHDTNIFVADWVE